MNIYPYVYRIDHPSGEFYIGYRGTNKVPAEADFGIRYKTSTKLLSYPFEEYTRTILAEFYLPTGATDAYDFEQALVYEHWGDPGLVNKRCHHNGKTRFSRSGMKLSDETKQKMAEAKRGKAHSVETKQKISKAERGKIVSDETRAKMSMAKRGRKFSDESRQKMSDAHRGKVHSAESRAKMSATRRAKVGENSKDGFS